MEESIYTLENTPPCARYEGGENNERLIRVWIYVTGLLGGSPKADELSQRVARLYDYKGDLIVAVRKELVPHIEAFFRKAWSEVGREFEEHVEFLNVDSERWDQLWRNRRFESDWQP